MVRAWYMDGTDADPHLPHQTDPPRFFEAQDLDKYGILYWKLDADNYEYKLKEIKNQRQYTYRDEVECSRKKLHDYDNTLKKFFTEHIHSDEEIRFITDGSGYYDFRDIDDKWVRIEVVKGDLIVIPAGVYHRFTLDEKYRNYCTAKMDYTDYLHSVPDYKKYKYNHGFDTYVLNFPPVGDKVCFNGGVILDLLVRKLPSFVKAIRLFSGDPELWAPYNRPADDHPSRKKYVEWLSTKV